MLPKILQDDICTCKHNLTKPRIKLYRAILTCILLGRYCTVQFDPERIQKGIVRYNKSQKIVRLRFLEQIIPIIFIFDAFQN